VREKIELIIKKERKSNRLRHKKPLHKTHLGIACRVGQDPWGRKGREGNWHLLTRVPRILLTLH